jgi:hypothetical protein
MTLPGWNSFETVSRLHTFFEIAGICVLGALVVCEVLSFSYGRRADFLAAQARTPRVEATGVFSNKQLPDGRFQTQIIVKVIAPHPLQLLTAEARGATIVDMTMVPNRAGMSSGTFLPGGPGVFVRTLQNPYSENRLEIFSLKPETFEITYTVE